jgi:hypothetical protein
VDPSTCHLPRPLYLGMCRGIRRSLENRRTFRPGGASELRTKSRQTSDIGGSRDIHRKILSYS